MGNETEWTQSSENTEHSDGRDIDSDKSEIEQRCHHNKEVKLVPTLGQIASSIKSKAKCNGFDKRL